eukprot:3269902-Rhodomonas_salina.1
MSGTQDRVPRPSWLKPQQVAAAHPKASPRNRISVQTVPGMRGIAGAAGMCGTAIAYGASAWLRRVLGLGVQYGDSVSWYHSV